MIGLQAMARQALCLYFLFGLMVSCSAKANQDSTRGDTGNKTDFANGSMCSSYKRELHQYIHNGSLVLNKIVETVPSIRTSFKYGSTWVRVPLNVTDLNGDGVFELVYLIDITAPEHKKNKNIPFGFTVKGSS